MEALGVTVSEDGTVLLWNTNPRQAATRTSFSVSTEEGQLVVQDLAKHAVGGVSSIAAFDDCIAYARQGHQVTATFPPLAPS